MSEQPAKTNGAPTIRRIPTSEPIFTCEQDVYTATFENARLEFDYVSPDRDGGIWAEMEAYLPAQTSPLLRTRINLLKGTGRRDAAKDLGARTNGLGLDWTIILEQASQWVVDRMRHGEGALVLRDLPEDEAASGHLLAPVLVEDGSTILFGPGGGAKSLIALAMALSLHSGTELIKGLPPTKPLRVAYCDWEWSPKVHRRRMRRLWGAGELPDLVYIKGRLPISEERDRLRHLIRDHRIDYLIIDSIVEAADDDPETANTARRFYATLNSLGIHALLVAHVTKNDTKIKGDTDAPFGSIFWSNAARSTWHVRPQANPPPDELTVGMYHRKPNDGPRQSPFALEFGFSDDRVTITRKAAAARADLDVKVPIRNRIVEALAGGTMQVFQIADELDESTAAVRGALNRNEGKDFVRLTRPDGTYTWGLIARPEE